MSRGRVRYGAWVQTDYRARDAALVMAGATTILLGAGWVILSPSLSSADPAGDFRQAFLIGLALTAAGAALMAAGLVCGNDLSCRWD